MYGFNEDTVNLVAIRERIAKMTDEALKRYGRAAAFMAGRNDRETWRVRLEEARAEWRPAECGRQNSEKRGMPNRWLQDMFDASGHPLVRPLNPERLREEAVWVVYQFERGLHASVSRNSDFVDLATPKRRLTLSIRTETLPIFKVFRLETRFRVMFLVTVSSAAQFLAPWFTLKRKAVGLYVLPRLLASCRG